MEIFRIKGTQKRTAEIMGTEELCCQTAEELAELTQALLKYRRAMGHGQKTEQDIPHILHSITEEIVDSVICIKELIYMLNISPDSLEFVEQQKIDRTSKRYGLNGDSQ